MSSMNAVRVATRNKPRTVALKAVLAIIVAMIAMPAPAQVEYVDPTIGNVGVLLVPTRPTVYMPNSMIRVYPIRSDAMDDQIESFPLTISSHRIQELFSLMPGEDGRPATLGSGNDNALLLLRLPWRWAHSHGVFGHRALWLFPHDFSVGQSFRGACEPSRRRIACAGRKSGCWRRAIQRHGCVCLRRIQFARSNPKLETSGGKSRLVVSSADSKVLEFRYGISFISVEQAKNNLHREIPEWGFEQVKDAGKKRWNETLGPDCGGGRH